MKDIELTELVIKYCEHFGEAYPIYAKPASWGDEDFVKDIRQCIETNTPSKANYSKNKEY